MKQINSASTRGAKLAKPHGERFHAVEIQVPASACEAAKALSGHRYLSRETPPLLPLADCDRRGECQCRYRHHEDRRGDSRREKWGGGGVRAGGGPPRTSRGRREED